MIRALASLLFIFLSSAAADAQRPQARVCAPANAERASIAGIAADPKAWLGKCVTVQGVYANERLYADEDAIYGLNRNAIGGYVDGQGSMLGFWRSRFTGRVADCAQAENDLLTGLLRSPGISLHGRTLGCVKPEGPFLVFMSQGELEPAALRRRTGKPVDLTLAPKDWPHLATVEQLALVFLGAVHTKNRPALTKFTGDAYAAEQLLADPDSAIADVAKPGPRQRQVFLHGAPAEGRIASEVCICRTKDCAKLWPVARRDADNQPSRPYACVRVDGIRQPNGDWRFDVDGSADYDGLPEPGRR